MKKRLLSIVFLFITITCFSQGNSGLGFNYQAVVRGVDGFVLSGQSVDLRFSLMPGQQATVASWIETHHVTTDAYGTVGISVGKGVKEEGVAATFKDINFVAVYYWLKVEIKEGSTYRELSYSALTSVPYAEVAFNAVGSPVGSVMPFAGDASKVPAGWFMCDGREVSRSEYATLYDVIGTVWGHGDNSNTFNLPDMRGMFLRGVSGDSGSDEDTETRLPLREGGNSGNNVGSFQDDAIRNITGVATCQGGAEASDPILTGAFRRSDLARWGKLTGGGSKMPSFTSTFDASFVVPVGSDNRPKNVYVNYIIKY